MSTEQYYGSSSTPFARFFNRYRSIISGVFVPRVLFGSPDDEKKCKLGTPTFPWLALNDACGTPVGQIIHVYDYNGTVAIPHGYMKCDGRQITKAAYEVEHGDGTWDKYIGSSVLEDKYLPTIDDALIIGGAATQDGTTPIPTVGANSRDISHSHATSTSTASNVNAGGIDGSPGAGWSGLGHTHDITLMNKAITLNTKPATIVAKAYLKIV